MRVLVLAVLTLVVAGCAGGTPFFHPAASLLTRADRAVEAGQYAAARALYDELLTRYPDVGAAEEARGRRAMVASVLEVARLREEAAKQQVELARIREALTAREADLNRLKADLAQREVELARVRETLAARQGELEQLKRTDLRIRGKRR
jgi:chromosome segregation ATPase